MTCNSNILLLYKNNHSLSFCFLPESCNPRLVGFEIYCELPAISLLDAVRPLSTKR